MQTQSLTEEEVAFEERLAEVHEEKPRHVIRIFEIAEPVATYLDPWTFFETDHGEQPKYCGSGHWRSHPDQQSFMGLR